MADDDINFCWNCASNGPLSVGRPTSVTLLFCTDNCRWIFFVYRNCREGIMRRKNDFFLSALAMTWTWCGGRYRIWSCNGPHHVQITNIFTCIYCMTSSANVVNSMYIYVFIYTLYCSIEQHKWWENWRIRRGNGAKSHISTLKHIDIHSPIRIYTCIVHWLLSNSTYKCHLSAMPVKVTNMQTKMDYERNKNQIDAWMMEWVCFVFCSVVWVIKLFSVNCDSHWAISVIVTPLCAT